MSATFLSSPDFVDISNKILRLAVEVATSNPSSAISCIHALEDAVRSSAPYSGYLCFARHGVCLLAAETAEYATPAGYEEVWKIDISRSASGTPALKMTQQSCSQSPVSCVNQLALAA